MRTVDLRCDCMIEADGTWMLHVIVSGLSHEEAAEIAEALQQPVLDAISNATRNSGWDVSRIRDGEP